MRLEAWGWNDLRQRQFEACPGVGLIPGRVVEEHRTHYQVATGHGELTAQTMGRVRNDAEWRSDLPGVGDFVAVRPSAGDGPATIESVLPRTSALIRKASGKETPQLVAANVDIVFIVMGLDGDFNLARLERFLTLVRESGSTPVIVANKADLSDDAAGMAAQIVKAAPGIAVHTMTANTGAGISGLEAYFEGNKTIVLVGSSGVGKSTLTNQLLGREAQATQDVREHDSRGRHTTTHRQLFLRAGGGSMIDTPGMRGLEVWTIAEPVVVNFEDIEALAAQCKFRNCKHAGEPACAVRAAVERGDLDPERLAAFARQPVRGHRGRWS